MIPTSNQIAQRIKDGDSEGFKLFFELNYPRYLFFAVKMLKDKEVAKDIVQNNFIKLWVRREYLDVTKSISALLLVSIRNEIFNYKKQYAVVNREEVVADYVDESTIIDDNAIELKEKIETVINSMPPKRKLIFIMSRDENLSSMKVAQLLNISKRTVDKHLELAIKQLRHSLQMFLF